MHDLDQTFSGGSTPYPRGGNGDGWTLQYFCTFKP